MNSMNQWKIVYGVVASLGFATYDLFLDYFGKSRANGIVDHIQLYQARFKWMYYGFHFGMFAFSADKKFL